MKKRILITDDDPDTQMLLGALLMKEGWVTFKAGNGEQCLGMIQEFSPDVILLDYYLPDMDGQEILAKIKEKGCNIPVIIITAYAIDKLSIDFLKLGAFAFLTKPLKKSDLIFATTKAFNHKTLWDQLAEYKGKDYDFLQLEDKLEKMTNANSGLEMGRFMLREKQKSYGLEGFFSSFLNQRQELQSNFSKLQQFVDSFDFQEKYEAKAACGSLSMNIEYFDIYARKTVALLNELKLREEMFKREDDEEQL